MLTLLLTNWDIATLLIFTGLAICFDFLTHYKPAESAEGGKPLEGTSVEPKIYEINQVTGEVMDENYNHSGGYDFIELVFPTRSPEEKALSAAQYKYWLKYRETIETDPRIPSNLPEGRTFEDPFEQFLVLRFCDYSNSVTFYLVIYFLFIYTFLYIAYSSGAFNKKYVLKYYFLALFTYIKNYILSLLSKNLEGIKFLWIIFFSFFVIFFFNIFGMFFYVYTSTSLPVVTTFFSFFFFFAIFIISIRKYNYFFFSTFYSSSPVVIFFLLTIIEILSYFIRLFSLSIRIFANMMSGHVLLKIFLMILFTALLSSGLGLIHVSVAFIILFVLSLEVLVAFLQAYVFTSLVSLYLMDSIKISAH